MGVCVKEGLKEFAKLAKGEAADLLNYLKAIRLGKAKLSGVPSRENKEAIRV